MEKVAVLGAGVMGRTLAAHMINAGLDVVLLDLEIKKGDETIQLAHQAIREMAKVQPSPVYRGSWLSRITTGTLERNLDLISDCDWVIEVVKEDFEVKKQLFQSICEYLTPETLLTSNTSGIQIAELSAILPDAIQRNFCGTHFFNPPRYMKLLEIIPGPQTSPENLSLLYEFGEEILGKGVVFAKDKPNFIANRIGVQAMMVTLHIMLRDGYSIEEVDKIMGPLVGRPKTAVFRTADLVGLDTLAHVCDNLYEAIPDDECRPYFKIPDGVRKMISKGLLGNKTKSGFYKKKVHTDGSKEICVINFDSLEYESKQKVNFSDLLIFKNMENLQGRLKKMVESKDRIGRFVWSCFSETLVYAANRLGDISDNVVNMDRAMRWGFNWELGPFEIWDVLGIEYVTRRLQSENRPVPNLILKMLEKGKNSFYCDNLKKPEYYDPESDSFLEIPPRPNLTVLDAVRKEEKNIIKTNTGASLLDLGDGVACLEFHSKMNSIGSDTIAMTFFAVAEVEKNFEALLVANQGVHFSAGANLMLLLMEAQEQNFEDIDLMVRQFQKATSALRYCKKPVIVAPHGLTLGGGCEFTLHGDSVQASAETNMGLVEAGVGLVPAGGGSKEMLLRTVGNAQERGDKYLFPSVQKTFERIGLAKVSTSAEEAREMGYLSACDGISINGDSLVNEATKRALGLIKIGYKPPRMPVDIPVLGLPAFSTLKMGLITMQEAGHISDHDRLIGTHLAKILTGGDLTPGSRMTERQVLDLEREAFLSLCGEKKTLERIHHMLTKGKPLRN